MAPSAFASSSASSTSASRSAPSATRGASVFARPWCGRGCKGPAILAAAGRAGPRVLASPAEADERPRRIRRRRAAEQERAQAPEPRPAGPRLASSSNCRAAELDALPLPEDVRDAVDDRRGASPATARGSRQRLYIGKLLRQHRRGADPRGARPPRRGRPAAHPARARHRAVARPPARRRGGRVDGARARWSSRPRCSSCARWRARRAPSGRRPPAGGRAPAVPPPARAAATAPA